MAKQCDLDCVLIGYNDVPFERYEGLVRQYGEDSEVYRDLRLSFVDLEGRKLTYVDLLNHVLARAGKLGNGMAPLRSGEIPNLAAAYLTSFLRRHGLRAAYVNLFQDEKEKLAEWLAEEPLCVAITTTFYVINFPVHEMVEFIRAHNPRTRIIVGGPLVANHVRNYQGEERAAALADLGADIYVVESQGELTLARVVSCLRAGGDLGAIPNLAWREGREIRFTPTVPESNSLDESYIDWRELNDHRLGPTIQTRTARSCAFKCSFCNYPTRAGRLVLADLETIEKELDSIRAVGARNVVFIDDTFNVPLPRFKEICRLMIRKGYDFNWYSYFRCSNADEEAVELMARSGGRGVFLGIESGSPTILENMNKRASDEAYRRGIQWLRQAGILSFGSFILGFPGETERTVRETTDFIRETGLDYYRAQMWYCEPGTPIFGERERFRIEGSGFVWSHATMTSPEAADHLERLFLSVREAEWLPQWSFDFWILPYLQGRGISNAQLREFMGGSNRMLALEVAALSDEERREQQQKYFDHLLATVGQWSLEG
jgi:radical SAM PhpK family P-methyltransferase